MVPDNGPRHLVIDCDLAYLLWNWSQDSDSPNYWEDEPLSILVNKIKRWIIEEAEV